MSWIVFIAVIFAALLHATWNALIKLDGSRLTVMWIMTLIQGGMGGIIALTRPFPEAEVWPWLVASGLTHAIYKLFLTHAYSHGDLSRVYPIARGAGPLFVAIAAIIWLNEPMTGRDHLGVAILGLGILLMARGVFDNGESRRLVPFALGSALATAGYTLVDGIGARISGDAVAYVAWLFVLDAVFYTSYSTATQGLHTLRATRRTWIYGSLASAASYAAYAVAVWAMTVAPIPLVAALRETSILFAVLIGWLAFGDRMDRGKVLAALFIVAGVAMTRL